MKHSEFKIGEFFRLAKASDQHNYSSPYQAVWLCTDVGTRTVIAIEIKPGTGVDDSWYNGPPYAVAEIVFDENDFDACFKDGGTDETS